MRAKGMTVADIARVSGHSEPTVRKYLRRTGSEGSRYRRRSETATKLEPYREHLMRRMADGAFNCVVLLAEIRALGYQGGVTQLKEFVQPHRRQFRVQASRRFETGPGEQAQVDWGYLGQFQLDGILRRVWLFVMVLGFSRYLFAECVTDTQGESLLWLHQKAFGALGGVPHNVLYDNMRTVTLGRHQDGQPRWQPDFLRFALHYDFHPRLTAPYKPRSKGKVEASVRYVKENFAPGRVFTDLPDLNGQLAGWLVNANNRGHGTTKLVPAVQLAEEALGPLPAFQFMLNRRHRRRVSQDHEFSFLGTLYSVPWRLAGREVDVEEGVGGQIRVYHQGNLVAEHRLTEDGARRQHLTAHDEGLTAWQALGPVNGLRQLLDQAPEVERRDLSVYDQVAHA